MLEGGILRAKTGRAEGEYQREVQQLGHVRKHELACKDLVKEKEQLFWREVSRAAERRELGSSAALPSPNRVDLRITHAHRELKDAIDQHKLARTVVQESSTRTVRCEAMVDTCHGMMKVERRKAGALREGQSSEELAELSTFLRTRVARSLQGGSGEAPVTTAPPRVGQQPWQQPWLRAGQAVTVNLVEGLRSLAAVNLAQLNLAQLNLAQKCVGEGVPTPMPKAPSIQTLPSPILPNQPPTHIYSHQVGKVQDGVAPAQPIHNTYSIHNAQLAQVGGQPSLSFECSFGGVRAPVGVTLVKAKEGGMQVVLNVSSMDLSFQVLRERSLIMQRLQASGFKVTSLTVQRGEVGSEGIAQGLARNRRGRLREDDESYIA